jgi:hypothetical protein
MMSPGWIGVRPIYTPSSSSSPQGYSIVTLILQPSGTNLTFGTPQFGKIWQKSSDVEGTIRMILSTRTVR